MVRGEPRRRARQQAVRVGVARDEEVEPPVAVHVRDGRPGVPAEGAETGLPGALGERPVALVPEERVEGVALGVVAGGRDVEIRRAVPVEIGRDTAAAAHRELRPRLHGHVLEAAAEVPEEAARRQPAARLEAGDVRLGVRVDDVEVEPAVPVVVEPADAAAHHRRLVIREAEAERVVAEVEADLVGDVGERERCAARDRRAGSGRAAHRREQEPPILRDELERPCQRRGSVLRTSRDGLPS